MEGKLSLGPRRGSFFEREENLSTTEDIYSPYRRDINSLPRTCTRAHAREIEFFGNSGKKIWRFDGKLLKNNDTYLDTPVHLDTPVRLDTPVHLDRGTKQKHPFSMPSRRKKNAVA